MLSKEIDKEAANPLDPNQEGLETLPAAMLDYFSDKCVPMPISREQQRELDDKEEKENKEKEREARQAQKELE